jgi:hypothetical protein
MEAALIDTDGVLTVSWQPLPDAVAAVSRLRDAGLKLALLTDIVLIGGAGPEFGYQALNEVFGHLQNGARLVALHRNLSWRTDVETDVLAAQRVGITGVLASTANTCPGRFAAPAEHPTTFPIPPRKCHRCC